MDSKYFNLLTILWPMLLAYYTVSKLKTSGASSASKKFEDLAKAIEQVAGVLLPVVILNTVRKTEISANLLTTFFVGFMLPIAVYLVIKLLSKNSYLAKLYPKEKKLIHMLLASFGGGNRGNLLLLTAFSSATAFGANVISQFIVLDLGNFLCILTVGFFVADTLSRKSTKLGFTDIVEKVRNSPVFYAAILIISQLPSFRHTAIGSLLDNINPIFDIVGKTINSYFAFFIFLAIFLRLEDLSKLIVYAGKVLLSFIFFRLISVAFIFIIFFFTHASIELYIATSVLLFMPPSSVLWLKLSQVEPLKTDSLDRKHIYLIPNLLYLVFMALAFVVALAFPELLAALNK